MLVERFTQSSAGTPAMDRDCGPLINAAQRDRVQGYIAQARASGIPVLAQGRIADGVPAGGYYVAPILFGPVPRDHRLACEEVFGPVLAVIPFDTEEEAIALANDTRYGLAGAVWTKDIHRGHRVAHALRTGTVWINAYRVVGPDVPFGGFGSSGLGRENGIQAVHEYTQTKAIWVELTGGTRDPFTLG
jgi:aldehyde dehydrogenase (NAD+)